MCRFAILLSHLGGVVVGKMSVGFESGLITGARGQSVTVMLSHFEQTLPSFTELLRSSSFLRGGKECWYQKGQR